MLLSAGYNDNEDDHTVDHNCDESSESSCNLSESLAVIEEVCIETQEQISNDLQSAYNGGLVSKETEEN